MATIPAREQSSIEMMALNLTTDSDSIPATKCLMPGVCLVDFWELPRSE